MCVIFTLMRVIFALMRVILTFMHLFFILLRVIFTHACDFDTLRVKLLFYNLQYIHKPKLQRHMPAARTFQYMVSVTYFFYHF
jgi:hypothetical protein